MRPIGPSRTPRPNQAQPLLPLLLATTALTTPKSSQERTPTYVSKGLPRRPIFVRPGRAAMPARPELTLDLLGAGRTFPRRVRLRARFESPFDQGRRALEVLVVDDPELRPALGHRKVADRCGEEGDPHLDLDPLGHEKVSQIAHRQGALGTVDLRHALTLAFGPPRNAIIAARAASFWSRPQGGPTDFPSAATVFARRLTGAPSAFSACLPRSFSGIATSFSPCAFAARTRASRNRTPSALCMRKCTARISSMLQSGMGSPTRTAQAVTSFLRSFSRFTASRTSRTAIRCADSMPRSTRSRAGPAFSSSAA